VWTRQSQGQGQGWEKRHGKTMEKHGEDGYVNYDKLSISCFFAAKCVISPPTW
jgi:hypothetical protein